MNPFWSPEKVMTEEEAEVLISLQFPKLEIVQIKIFAEGFDNTAFLINDRYVFRFPRREIAGELIKMENRLLPKIAPILPLQIPNPQFIGKPHDDYRWSFSGYEILKGKVPSKLTRKQRVLSAKPIALFLRKLHDFPLQQVVELGIPYDKLGRMDIHKRKPLLEERVISLTGKSFINQQQRDLIIRTLTTVDGPLSDMTKTLVHGDLHIRNMLVNDRGEISAILDWGDVHIGSPAIDLSIVYSFLPLEGRELFFQLYGNVSEEIKKLARFKAIYTYVLLLLYAHDQEDMELVDDCLCSLNLALEE
ncbi:phosphotransferase [Robertmurraya massiliosenegalensis]|uniref:phosphotransferase n=1 Tax=Robertmurraya TaxID=2837507 RepID=UPI0039A61FCB